MDPQSPIILNQLSHSIIIGKVTEEKLLKFVTAANECEYKTQPHWIAIAAQCGFAFLDIGSKYVVSRSLTEYFTKWGILQCLNGTFSYYPYPEES
jgi:hypothetical protein